MNIGMGSGYLQKAAAILICLVLSVTGLYAQSGGWDSFNVFPNATVGYTDHGNGVIQLMNTTNVGCASSAVHETTDTYDIGAGNFSKCYQVFFACPGGDNAQTPGNLYTDTKGDGMAFSFWRSTATFNINSGATCAGGIGYGNGSTDGKMITIEFDTYNNIGENNFDGIYGAGAGTTGINDEIAIHKDGNSQNPGRLTSTDAGNLEDGKEHKVCINYNSATGTLSASIDGVTKMSYAMGGDNFLNYFGAGAKLNQTWSSGKYGATSNFTVSKGASISDNAGTLVGLPNPQMTDKTICAGSPTTFDPGTYTTYVWSGLGTGTNQTTPASTAGNYIVNVTNPAGCFAADTVALIVNPIPAVTDIPKTICSGGSFDATPIDGTNGTAPAGTTYSWAAPAGSGFSGGAAGTNQATITGTLSTTGNTQATATYTVTPKLGTCTGAPFKVTVTVNPVPVISNIPKTICSGAVFTATPVNATNGTVPANTTYTWPAPVATGITGSSAGTNLTAISQTLTNTTTANATATYVVTPKSGTCTGAPFNVVVTVNPPLVITTQPPTPLSDCAGQSITTSVAATGLGPLVYSWLKNNVAIVPAKTTSSLTLSPLVAGDAGSYTVKITDANACSILTSTATVVTVGGNVTPSVTLAISQNKLCGAGAASDTIRLTATPVGGGTAPKYTFKINGVTVAGNQASPNYTYIVPANTANAIQNLSFTVDMLSNSGCLTAGATNPATSTAVPAQIDPQVTTAQANINETMAIICAPTRTLTVSALPNLYTGTWTTTAPATVNNGVVSLGKNVLTTTTYTVESPLKLCPLKFDTVSTYRAGDVTNPDPVRSNNKKICSTTAAPLLTGITPLQAGETAAWSVATGTTATISAAGQTGALKTGKNEFIYTISNLVSNCPPDTALVTIVVEKEVDAALAGADAPTCASDYQLNATPVTNGTGTWTSVPAGLSYTANANAPKAVAGTLASGQAYTFTWTVSNGAGAVCPDKKDDVVITQAGSITSATPVATQSKSICQGDTDPLLNTTGVAVLKPAESGAWSVKSPVTATITAAGQTGNLQVGNNVFEYTITTTVPGCTPSIGTVTIKVDPKPGPALAITGLQTLCAGATGITYSIAPVADAVTYDWTVPAGATIKTGDKTTTITVDWTTTGGQITVTPVNACGKGTPSPVTITINPNLTPSVTILGSDSVCAFEKATFYVSAAKDSGNTPKYEWYVNATKQAATGVAFSSTTLVNGDLIKVVMTSNEKCTPNPVATSNVIPITVVANVTPDVTITPLVVCAGTPQTITAYPVAGGNNPVYRWKLNNALQTETGPTLIKTFAQNDVIDVMMTSSSGCAVPDTAKSSKTIKVIPVPVATAADVQTCSGITKAILLSSNTAGTIFRWTASAPTDITGSADGVSTPTDSTITQALFSSLKQPGDVTYTVTPEIRASATCIGSPIAIKSTVKPIPVATATTLPICSGENPNIALASDITPAPTTFNWTGSGNGAAATGSSATVLSEVLTNTSRDAVSTVYKITPVADGCTGLEITRSVLVKPLPAALGSNPPICSGDMTNIDLTTDVTTPGAAALTSFTWTAVGAGATSSAANGTASPIKETLTNTGNVNGTVTFSVIPTVDACVGAAKDIIVDVKPIPVLTVTAVSPTICGGAPARMGVKSTVANTLFDWTMTSTPAGAVGGTASGTAVAQDSLIQTLTNVTTSNATATYSMTPTANQCVGQPKGISIDVSPAPDAKFVSGTLSICSGTTTDLKIGTSLTGIPVTLAWTSTTSDLVNVSGNGNSSGTATVTIADVLTNAGSNDATVTYTVTPSTALCPGMPLPVIVTVKPIPVAIVTNSKPVICSGDVTSIAISSLTQPTTFVISADGIAGSFSENGTSIAQTLSTNSQATANYSVVPTANGCPGAPVQTSVVVHPIPVPNVGTPAPYCEDEMALLGGTPDAAYEYLWTPNTGLNDNTIANPITVVPVTTTYTLHVSLKAFPACFDEKKVTVNVSPKFTVDAGPDQLICAGDPVILTATPAGLASYVWSNGAKTSTINVTPNDSTKYIVKAIMGECEAEDSVYVNVKNFANPTLFIPNSFSPNGDGHNEIFKAEGEGVIEFEGMIFSRWGEMFYRWTDIKSGWNGTVPGGDKVNEDVYIYSIRVRNICEKKFNDPKTGTITIVK